MCIYLAVMYAANTFIYKISLLHSVTFNHRTIITKQLYVFIGFSFDVKELVAVEFVLFSSLLDLLFQVFDGIGKGVEDVYDMVLLGDGGNRDKKFFNYVL